jgi:hypothetical protein
MIQGLSVMMMMMMMPFRAPKVSRVQFEGGGVMMNVVSFRISRIQKDFFRDPTDSTRNTNENRNPPKPKTPVLLPLRTTIIIKQATSSFFVASFCDLLFFLKKKMTLER